MDAKPEKVDSWAAKIDTVLDERLHFMKIRDNET